MSSNPWRGINPESFEELFNMNELGSAWLTYEELENFYMEHKVLEAKDPRDAQRAFIAEQ
jgi:hypothetical protein